MVSKQARSTSKTVLKHDLQNLIYLCAKKQSSEKSEKTLNINPGFLNLHCETL